MVSIPALHPNHVDKITTPSPIQDFLRMKSSNLNVMQLSYNWLVSLLETVELNISLYIFNIHSHQNLQILIFGSKISFVGKNPSFIIPFSFFSCFWLVWSWRLFNRIDNPVDHHNDWKTDLRKCQRSHLSVCTIYKFFLIQVTMRDFLWKKMEFFDFHGIVVSKLLSQQQKFTFNQPSGMY